MGRLGNIAIPDYQESVTTGQTHRQKDTGQSDPFVLLCFAGDTRHHAKVTSLYKGKYVLSKYNQETLFS